MMEITYTIRPCWLGLALIAATERGVCAVALGDDPAALERELAGRFPGAALVKDPPELEGLAARVLACLEDPSRAVDVPLDLAGTPFQRRVWQALGQIPAGQTVTYGALAARMGQPAATRAVARACGANPAAVLVPCHRVVGSGGALTGYRWGIGRKKALLEREQKSG